MAAALISLAPAPQLEHLNPIISPRSYLPLLDIRNKKNNLERIIFPRSRYFSSNQKDKFRNNITTTNVLYRRFASVSAVALFALPYSHRPVCSRCDRFRLPSSPLLPLCRSRAPGFRARFIMSQSRSDNTNHQDCTKSVRCLIKGRVQGVFYRNWTVENANQIGLNGWVRNRRDGSVEAVFSGKPDAVDEMQQRCRRGPPDAMVTGMEIFPYTDDPGTGFRRAPTI